MRRSPRRSVRPVVALLARRGRERRDFVEGAGAPSSARGAFLFGPSSSSRVNKVQWAAAEAGVAYVQVPTPTADLRTNDAYRRLNPKGTVPTWVDCDPAIPFVLNESNTIVAHIAEGGALSPRDPRLRMLAWQWQEYAGLRIRILHKW